MRSYDPLVEPDPEEWLALDEQIRLTLVEEYHRRARVRLSRAKIPPHATMHVIIENQIAAKDPVAVRCTANRLIGEGLDRHDAIHAIAAVSIGLISEMVRDQLPFSEPEYVRQLRSLTADKWQRGDW